MSITLHTNFGDITLELLTTRHRLLQLTFCNTAAMAITMALFSTV